MDNSEFSIQDCSEKQILIKKVDTKKSQAAEFVLRNATF